MWELFNIAFACMMLLLGQSAASMDSSGVCYTKDCIHTAAAMLKNHDPTADPCHNFYKFACGRFSERYLPQNFAVGNMNVLHAVAQAQVKAMLEAEMDPLEAESFRKVKLFYESCITAEEVGIQPLHDLAAKFGGWPVIEGDNWNEDQFDWLETSQKMMSMGILTQLIHPIINVDYYHGGITIKILRPQFNILLSRYSSEITSEEVQRIKKSFKKTSVVLGANSTSEQVIESAKEIAEFINGSIQILETGMVKLYDRYYYSGDKDVDYLNFTALTELIPEINWITYFQSAVDDISEDYIRNATIEFSDFPAENLRRFVDFIVSTPKRIVANYLVYSMVRYIHKEMDYIRPTMMARNVYSSPEREETEEERSQRWRQCLETTENQFLHLVTAMYIQKYMPKGTKARVQGMLEEMIDNFNATVRESNWLDQEIVDELNEKMEEITIYVSHPDELADPKLLDRKFGHVEIEGNNIIMNVIRMIKFKKDFELKRQLNVNKKHWPEIYTILQTNAYYAPYQHYIMIPASIIKDMFYLADRPQFANYAILGYVLAHELTHSFFSSMVQQQRYYYFQGTVIKELFEDRITCLTEQYKQQKLHGFRHDPTDSLDDDVADNTGLYLTYKAYQKHAQENGPEQLLPGLPFNLKQQFWLAFGNSWCQAMKQDDAQSYVSGSHSPAHVRINNVLMNMPQFSEDFNCPLGSAMNPAKKCPIWRTNA